MTKPSYSYKHTPSAGGSMTLVYIPIYYYMSVFYSAISKLNTEPIMTHKQKNSQQC